MYKTIVISGAAVLSVLITTIGGCCAHKNILITEAIKAGADPIVAACAIGDSGGRECYSYGISVHKDAK